MNCFGQVLYLRSWRSHSGILPPWGRTQQIKTPQVEEEDLQNGPLFQGQLIPLEDAKLADFWGTCC